MKLTHILSVLFLGVSLNLKAQIELPALSPLQKIEQTVGLSTITVKYSRPYLKGRTIFGGLEKYGELWRTGANRSTKVTFSDEVVIDGKKVKAGTYSLITRPNIKEWEVYFYTELQHWGVPDDFSLEKVAASIKVPVSKTSKTVDMLTISIENITPFQADMTVSWENTKVEIPIQTTTSDIINKKIEERLAGPDMGDYYLAAKFKLSEGVDLVQATEWINKSIDMSSDKPVFWTYQLLAEIQAARGMKQEALKTAEKALSMAKAGENNDFYINQINAFIQKTKS